MSKDYQYGRGLSDGLLYGMFLSFITAQIKELSIPIEQSLLFHNIFESIATGSDQEKQKTIRKNIRGLKSDLTPRIQKINDWIDLTNQFIAGLDFNAEIPSLNQAVIIELVEQRLKTMYELRDVQKISNEHFRLLLQRQLQGPPEAVQKFYQTVESERHRDAVNNLRSAAKAGITQALDICSIGYYSTAVFVAGRTVEESLNSYYAKIFRLGITPAFELDKMSFENKINKLHSQGYLDEKLYHDLSSTRIIRNDFGHPSEKILTKEESYLNLQSIAKILVELEKRIFKLRKKTN